MASHEDDRVSDQRARDTTEWLRTMRRLRAERAAEREVARGGSPIGVGRDAVDGAGAADGGEIRMIVRRPDDFVDRYPEPPTDVIADAALAPEEVLLSFAMLAEAGRFGDQWPLLDAASQTAFRDAVRQEAVRVGMPSVLDALAARPPEAMWADGFASGDATMDRTVRWRSGIDGDQATVWIERGTETIAAVPFTRDDGVWRLHLVDLIEVEPVDGARMPGVTTDWDGPVDDAADLNAARDGAFLAPDR